MSLKAIQFPDHVKIVIAGERVSPDSQLKSIPAHQVNRRQGIVYEYVRAGTKRDEWVIHHLLDSIYALLVHADFMNQ